MKRILVIDDDAAILDILTKILVREGYEVETAEHGAAGLAKFEEKPYDLIITDIVMPVKDGLDTILEIRKQDQDVPVIAISGGGKIPKERYLEVAGYLSNTKTLPKPFSREQILSAVAEHLSPDAADDGLQI